jgi:hypothetical protein
MTERILILYLGGAQQNSTTFVEGYDLPPLASQVPYYSIESGGSLSSSAGKVLDNPDQRIAEDVISFTAASLAFGLTILRYSKAHSRNYSLRI